MTFRYIRPVAGLMLSASLFLTGCGLCPEMIELTDEDVEQIALYSSHAISKFNLNQDKGLVFVPHDDRDPDAHNKKKTINDEPEDTDETEAESTDAEDEGTEEPNDEAPPMPEDAEVDGNPSDTSGSGASADAGVSVDTSESTATTTLTDVIGVSGISFIYKGAKVSTDYRSGDVYDLSPDEGYELLVMRIKAKNTTDSDIKMDLTDKGLRFMADYEGRQAKSQATLLLNDLTTYEGTVKAGKTKNLIVLFQFPLGTVKDTQSVTLSLPRTEGTYNIDLALSSKK